MREKVVKVGQYKCLGPTITESKIKFLQRALAQDKTLQNFENLCKIFSCKTRLQIFWLLNKEKELCVCDLADILKATVSAISHQLRILRKAQLVKNHRRGQTIFYSLAFPAFPKLKNFYSLLGGRGRENKI